MVTFRRGRCVWSTKRLAVLSSLRETITLLASRAPSIVTLAVLAAVIADAGEAATKVGGGGSSDQQETGATGNQLQLQEVVVTAQKTRQKSQDVPISITALSGEQLEDRGVLDTDSLGKVASGVMVTSYGSVPATTTVNIRGIGQLDYGDHEEAPIALYVDGAYVSFQAATGAAMFDVQDLEVLRGPQGTLFGRNATGGLIQITSNQPTDTPGGYVNVDYGSYNRAGVEAAINSPIDAVLSTRFAFDYTRQSAFVDNDYGPGDGGDNTLGARWELSYHPDADTKDLIEMFASQTFRIPAGLYSIFPAAPDPGDHSLTVETSGPLFVQYCAQLGYTVAQGATDCVGYHNPYLGNFHHVQTPEAGHFSRDLLSFTNTLIHSWERMTLTSITNYFNLNKSYAENDSNDPVAQLLSYTSAANAGQFSQELRLNGDSPKLRWQGGLYFLYIDGTYAQYLPYGGLVDPYQNIGAPYSARTLSYATFGQVDWDLTDKLVLTTGLRAGTDHKSISLTAYCLTDAATCENVWFAAPDGAHVAGSINNFEWSGRLEASYKFTPEVMGYAGVNRGTKGGEVYACSYCSPGFTFSDLVIKPEVLLDYEAGIKSELFDRRLRLNVDGFYYHYSDYQAYKYVGVAAVLFNAQARDYGTDIDITALLGQGFTASLGVTAMHTKVLNVELPDGTFADQQQANAPRESANANLRKEISTSIGEFFVQGGLTYSASLLYSTVNEPILRNHPYALGDASLGWISEDGSWHTTFRVTNVTNRQYATYIVDNSASGGFGDATAGAPRWFTVEVGGNF